MFPCLHVQGSYWTMDGPPDQHQARGAKRPCPTSEEEMVESSDFIHLPFCYCGKQTYSRCCLKQCIFYYCRKSLKNLHPQWTKHISVKLSNSLFHKRSKLLCLHLHARYKSPVLAASGLYTILTRKRLKRFKDTYRTRDDVPK